MQFQSSYGTGFHYGKAEFPIRLNFVKPSPAALVLHKSPVSSESDPQIVATLIVERQPSAKIQDLLRQLPKGRHSATMSSTMEVRAGSQPLKMLFSPGYPKPLEDFVDQLHREMDERTRRALKLLRWRYHLKSHPDGIASSFGMAWSEDGVEWNSLHSKTYAHQIVEAGLPSLTEPQWQRWRRSTMIKMPKSQLRTLCFVKQGSPITSEVLY